MGLFTEKYNTPFDNESSRRPYNEKPTALHIKPAGYMTTRSAVFMGFTLVSLCIEFIFEGQHLWWPALCSFAVLMFWTFTFRFFMPRKLAILSLIACIGLFYGACLASSKLGWCSPSACAGFVPMALGMMTLSRFCADGEEEYRPASPVKEILLPYIAAAAASLAGTFITAIAEKSYIFISLLAATAILIFGAWAYSAITGTPHYLTSRELTEFWNIPVADFEEFRRFCIARAEFALVCAGSIAISLAASNFLKPEISSIVITPAALLASVGLGYLMIVTGRPGDRKSIFGTRYFMSEALIGAAFVMLPFINSLPGGPSLNAVVTVFVFAVCGDILVTGLLSVIRRRLIFVSKSKFIDGLPFYLILVSYVIMLFETAVYHIPGLI